MVDSGTLTDVALAALRDADRQLHVARVTHLRELAEGVEERRAALRILGMGAAVDTTALHGRGQDDDAVVALQHLGEAIAALKRAIAALPPDDPVHELLIVTLDQRHPHLAGQIDALARAVRAGFNYRCTARPDLAADQAPLPNWNHLDRDDEDLARAAGVRLPPKPHKWWVLVLCAIAGALTAYLT